MDISKSAIKEAVEELKIKSYEDIERETAIKWAARAAAACILGKLKEFEDYRHEAIEHAAFVDSIFLDDVKASIDVIAASIFSLAAGKQDGQ